MDEGCRMVGRMVWGGWELVGLRACVWIGGVGLVQEMAVDKRREYEKGVRQRGS